MNEANTIKTCDRSKNLAIQLTMEDSQRVVAICMDENAGEAPDFIQEMPGQGVGRCLQSSRTRSQGVRGLENEAMHGGLRQSVLCKCPEKGLPLREKRLDEMPGCAGRAKLPFAHPAENVHAP